jgi:hypothetical protein
VSHLQTSYQWRDEIKRHLPGLSVPQARVLALWSIGIVLAGKATLTAVTVGLTLWIQKKRNTLRQCLREWYWPAKNKRGEKRVSLDPQQHFADLTAWVLSLLPGNQIALAMDASTNKDNLTVLCMSVLISGSALPIAWHILVGNEPEHWKPHWLDLLECVGGSFGSDYDVIVLTDRGLWAPWLYQAIADRGWHPVMRTKGTGAPGHEPAFQKRHGGWHPLGWFAPKRGQQRCVVGRAFKKQSLPCRLIVFFGEDAQEPWYLLTDMAIDDGRLYGLRYWIEHQFKVTKSDGLDWEKSRITDCDRAARMWLAYAVSLLWVQSFGSDAEAKDLFGEGAALVGPVDRPANARQCKNTEQCDLKDSVKTEPCAHTVPGNHVCKGGKQPGTPCIDNDTAKKNDMVDTVEPMGTWGHAHRMISLFLKGVAVLTERLYQGASLQCPMFATSIWPSKLATTDTS